MRQKVPKISGQWLGHFKYGPEYEKFYGEEVEFSLVLEEIGNGQFEGKCFELDGVGANESVTFVKGYVDGNLIHFVKEYEEEFILLEDGTLEKLEPPGKSILTYDGEFDYRINCYVGTWELESQVANAIDGVIVELFTGTWELTKLSDK